MNKFTSAALHCTHEIDSERIIIKCDDKQDGNALFQLDKRLADLESEELSRLQEEIEELKRKNARLTSENYSLRLTQSAEERSICNSCGEYTDECNCEMKRLKSELDTYRITLYVIKHAIELAEKDLAKSKDKE